MPKTAPSPEAAQRKLWKQELKHLEAQRRKFSQEARSEANKHVAVLVKAKRETLALEKHTNRQLASIDRKLARGTKDFDSRIAVLKGRLGI